MNKVFGGFFGWEGHFEPEFGKNQIVKVYFHFSIIQFELKIFVRSLIRGWKTSSLLDFLGYAVALDEKMVSSQWYRWGVAVSNERERVLMYLRYTFFVKSQQS